MNKAALTIILSSALFAFGCVEDTTPGDTSTQERTRCGSKCDDPTTALKVLDGLKLVEADGKYGLVSGTVGELDEEVWVDIEIDGDIVVYTEMYPSENGETYSTRESFELPTYEKMTIVAFGAVGETRYEQKFSFEGDATEGTETGAVTGEDPFEAAYDVEAGVITIPEDAEVPAYQSAQVDSVLGLGGTEFWQKWDGGHNPSYSYGDGTDAGRKCMYASARRFEAVMTNPPQAIVDLTENSDWGGRFFNWNDDFSPDNANGSAGGAVLWAWRTSLVKWISQTGTNGKCYLPTKSMVERFAQVALERASSEDGAIEGAQSR